MWVFTHMRSIWETIVRWLSEAGDDGEESAEVKARRQRAHDAMRAKGLDPTRSGDQRRRDAMARVMQDPDASKVAREIPPEDAEHGGRVRMQGLPGQEPEDLPKPVQGAAGSASGIGAGAVAAKNAVPSSVSLGARARRFDPGVSGIKQQLGVSPDAYYDNSPVRVDPTTGKFKDLRGRPKKAKVDPTSVENQIEKLRGLLQNPKTEKQKQWLKGRIKDLEDELASARAEPERPEVVHEPFADKHAQAQAANMAKRPVDRSKIHTYDAGAFADTGDRAHLPKSGNIRQTGKDANIGASSAGSSKLTAAGDVRKGGFIGQRFSPAGHTAADDDEWADNPELSARRMGGKGGQRLGYARQDVGQRGRMTLPATAGKGSEVFYNPYTGEHETDDQMRASLARPDIRAQIAAKLAMRGADIANKRFGAEKRPHAGRSSAVGLGNVVPKDAQTQKAQAAVDAIASKPLPISTRRDDEPKKPGDTQKHQYAPEPTQQGQSGGSAGGADPGPIDRNRMKQMLAQRIAQMAAKKRGP